MDTEACAHAVCGEGDELEALFLLRLRRMHEGREGRAYVRMSRAARCAGAAFERRTARMLFVASKTNARAWGRVEENGRAGVLALVDCSVMMKGRRMREGPRMGMRLCRLVDTRRCPVHELLQAPAHSIR